MKVFIIRANNGQLYPEDYREWNVAVYLSEEAAKQFILNERARYYRDMHRIEELEDAYPNWTIEMEQTLNELNAYWGKAWNCCPGYNIEEYDVIDTM